MTKKNRKDHSNIFKKALVDSVNDSILNQSETNKDAHNPNFKNDNGNNDKNENDDNDSTMILATDEPSPQQKSIEDKTALVHWKALSQAIGGSSSKRKNEDFPFPSYEKTKIEEATSSTVDDDLENELLNLDVKPDVPYAASQAVSSAVSRAITSGVSLKASSSAQSPAVPSAAVLQSVSPVTALESSPTVSPEVKPAAVPPAAANTDSEKTVAVNQNYYKKISEEEVKKKINSDVKKSLNISEKTKTDFRPRNSISVSVNSTEAALLVEENHRIAQERILQLEKELEKIRSENIELVGHTEILNLRIEQMKKQIAENNIRFVDIQEAHTSELSVLKSNFEFKMKELDTHKERNKELEWRLASDLRKVRVRERELENRLEIAKVERNALMKVKDDIILELKYQIETLQLEMESYKLRSTEQHKVLESNQEQFKRVVRALRLALSNLENSDEHQQKPLKKAE